ncbi:hypothetical protein PoB_004266800, partial [Plakobranchus ocellatus]
MNTKRSSVEEELVMSAVAQKDSWTRVGYIPHLSDTFTDDVEILPTDHANEENISFMGKVNISGVFLNSSTKLGLIKEKLTTNKSLRNSKDSKYNFVSSCRRAVGRTVVSESALRSVETLLSWVQSPPRWAQKPEITLFWTGYIDTFVTFWLCLPKRQLFLAILALTFTACIFSISFFHISTISTLKSAQKTDASNTDGENNVKLVFDSLQTESNSSSRTTADDFLFLKNIRSASGLNGCVTQEELSLKFQRCNQASEKRDRRCKAVHATPDSYWRSQPSGETRTHDGDFQRMKLASECCAFNYPNLLANSPRDPPMAWETDYLCCAFNYPNLLANSPRDPPMAWETDYLCKTPALATIADTAYASNSLVRLVGREGAAQEGKSADDFSVGDQIVLEVVVRNGRKEIQRLGGDSVRVWLVNPKLGASVVADVTDLKNGSYRARSVLPWGGEVKVRATIAHTRHLFRTVMYIQ